MKRALALALALVMTMALVACGGNNATGSTPNPSPSSPGTSEPNQPAVDPDAWKYGGDLIIGTANAWTSFDPHQTTQSSLGNKYSLLHYTEGMAVKDINGKIYPQVCDFEESADGLTIKFTLRERYFSNGEKITMDDVWASIQRAAALLSEANFNKYFQGAVVKVEGDSVIFTTESYNINLLSMLVSDGTQMKILPKAICDKYPVSGGTVQPCGLVMGGEAPVIDIIEDAIGSGPYKITAWREEEFSLGRNENYVAIPNADAVGVAKEAKCYLDTITFKLNSDASSRSAATMAGEYHIGSVSADAQETAKTMGVKFIDAGTTWTHGIFFNLSEENADSPVADVNVRKAIRAVIDIKAMMLSVVDGDESRVQNLEPYAVVKESEAYRSTKMEDSGEWNVKDANKAKAYLAQSGYNGEEITYLVNSGGGAFYKAAMVAIPAMESIGLKVNLWVVDTGSHSGIRKDPKGGHDIACWEVQKNTENPVLHATIVTGTQGWWSSPARNEAIAIMQTTPTGSAESVAAYNAYLDAVIDECPYILFGHPMGLLAVRENVETNTVGQMNYYYWNSYFNDNQK